MWGKRVLSNKKTMVVVWIFWLWINWATPENSCYSHTWGDAALRSRGAILQEWRPAPSSASRQGVGTALWSLRCLYGSTERGIRRDPRGPSSGAGGGGVGEESKCALTPDEVFLTSPLPHEQMNLAPLTSPGRRGGRRVLGQFAFERGRDLGSWWSCAEG